ncbi:MAG TPA: PA14 domain-containing protein, partial [Pirellulales bacterium]|nr:PA14 domain-containing protein [Pirellulales bacterium]
MRTAGVVLFIGLQIAGLARASDDDDEPEYRAGLVAHYADAGGRTIVRRDPDIAFLWRGRSPDSRLDAGNFTARWEGRLFSIVPGPYRLHVFAAGKVRLKLGDQTLLEAESPDAAWLEAKPVDLSYGYHRLTVEYTSPGGESRIGLFWSGPQFQLEPIPARNFFHAPADAPSQQFEQGQLLVRALRCEACHDLPNSQTALTAPALDRLRGNLNASWMVDWLSAAPASDATKDETSITDVSR